MIDFEKIKQWFENADAIVINSGAGMGIDSGLADYRGNDGQWGQVETESKKSIFEVVNPDAFLQNPAYSWKLFATRMNEYATTTPHNGFFIIKNWIKHYNLDYFALTSNIDGHFQKAGFDENKVRELHGTLEYFQSSDPKLSKKVWKNQQNPIEILENIEKEIYPICPYSHVMARPNVYMFRDSSYINTHSKEQEGRFKTFLEDNQGKNILVLEIGSGPHVQTVYKANIIRINPKDFAIKTPNIGISKGALEALTEINNYLNL